MEQWIIGLEANLINQCLERTGSFLLVSQPTRTDRGWVVNPFGSGKNPWYAIPAGFPPALFATILIFMDQQITAVIINRKEHKLKVIIECKTSVDAFVKVIYRSHPVMNNDSMLNRGDELNFHFATCRSCQMIIHVLVNTS